MIPDIDDDLEPDTRAHRYKPKLYWKPLNHISTRRAPALLRDDRSFHSHSSADKALNPHSPREKRKS